MPDDGVVFQPDSVRGTRIRDDQEYGGVRITLNAYVGTARIPMQIDVGFGDAITPEPLRETFPAVLDFPAPHPRVYPRETVVAEKFQAMVHLGMTNSRMKDFYDVWFLGLVSCADVLVRRRAFIGWRLCAELLLFRDGTMKEMFD